jgi:hypothetical protein
MPYKDKAKEKQHRKEYQTKHKTEIALKSKQYRLTHRDFLNQYRKEHYAANIVQERAKQKIHREKTKQEKSDYNKKYRKANLQRCLETSRKYHKDHRKELIEYDRRYYYETGANEKRKNEYKELKKQAYEILGNKCCQCGIIDVRVLQIDHINGGGKKEIEQIKTSGVYKKIINGEKGYQLLCANDNWIKRIEKKEQKTSKRQEKILTWSYKLPKNRTDPQD